VEEEQRSVHGGGPSTGGGGEGPMHEGGAAIGERGAINSFILVREGMLLEAPGTIECAVVGLGAEWRPFCGPASG
jgi:hypothetical protein